MHPEGNAKYFDLCRAWRYPLEMVKYYNFFGNALRLTNRCFSFLRSGDFFSSRYLYFFFFSPFFDQFQILTNQKYREFYFSFGR